MEERREGNWRCFRKRDQEAGGVWGQLGLGLKLGSCALKYKYSRFGEHMSVKTFLVFLHKSRRGVWAVPSCRDKVGPGLEIQKSLPEESPGEWGSQKGVGCPQEAAQGGSLAEWSLSWWEGHSWELRRNLLGVQERGRLEKLKL